MSSQKNLTQHQETLKSLIMGAALFPKLARCLPMQVNKSSRVTNGLWIIKSITHMPHLHNVCFCSTLWQSGLQKSSCYYDSPIVLQSAEQSWPKSAGASAGPDHIADMWCGLNTCSCLLGKASINNIDTIKGWFCVLYSDYKAQGKTAFVYCWCGSHSV